MNITITITIDDNPHHPPQEVHLDELPACIEGEMDLATYYRINLETLRNGLSAGRDERYRMSRQECVDLINRTLGSDT